MPSVISVQNIVQCWKSDEAALQLIDLAADCWRQDPEMRPSMSQVRRRLESIASDLRENRERLKKQTSRRTLVP